MTSARSRDGRDFDLVLYGVTGFTGRLVAQYLAEHLPNGLRVALAGRRPAALAELHAALPAAAKDWPVLPASSDDTGALARIAASAKAVLSTVGPYRIFGMPLVAACAKAGTDYVDVTGEIPFMREGMDRYGAVARQSGARMVQTCGFASVPSDLGVWDLARRVDEDGAGELTDAVGLAVEVRGGTSGGTNASMLHGIAEVRSDPRALALAMDPYALSPDHASEPDLGPQPDRNGFDFDPGLGTWLGPYFYARLDERVVRRTNALLDYAYGRRLRYREAVALGTGGPALWRRLALGARFAWVPLLVNPRFGAAIEPALRRLWRQPGAGPSERARRTNRFSFRYVAQTSSGAVYLERVESPIDPYEATAVMMAEMGLSLVLDRDRLPDRTGFLTPAAAGGGILLDRLRAAGLVFEPEHRDAIAGAPSETRTPNL